MECGEVLASLSMKWPEAQVIRARAAIKLIAYAGECLFPEPVHPAGEQALDVVVLSYRRNVRVHTLHDSVDYLSKEAGCYLLTGELPNCPQLRSDGHSLRLDAGVTVLGIVEVEQGSAASRDNLS